MGDIIASMMGGRGEIMAYMMRGGGDDIMARKMRGRG